MKRLSLLVVMGLAPLCLMAQVDIDFRNGQWTSVLGTTPRYPNSLLTDGVPPTTANQVLDGSTGFNVQVTSTFFGTASKGPNNLKLDPPNTPGFTFQNRGTGDLNTGTTMNNFQRIDFAFSGQVRLNFIEITDIDRSGNTPTWVDAVAVQLWNGGPVAYGDVNAIAPTISTAALTNLTVVTPASSPFTSVSNAPGHVYASTGGNTINSSLSTATFSSTETVDGFSVFFWNQRSGTGGQHGIALRVNGNEIVVIPEVSSLWMAGLFLTACAPFARKRLKR